MNRIMDLPEWADCWVIEVTPAKEIIDVTGHPIYYDAKDSAIDMTDREVYEPPLDHEYSAVLIGIFIAMMAGCMLLIGW